MNREIYRRARESSVRGAYSRLEEILADEGRTLVAIISLSLARRADRELAHLAEPGPAGGRADPRDGGGRRGGPRPPDPGHLARRDRRPGPRARADDGAAARVPRAAGAGRRSSRRSARCRRRWPTGSGTRSRACAPPPSSCAATPARLPPPSTSTPSSTRWTGWTGASAICSSFSRPAPFHPVRESLPRLVEELLPAVAQPLREQRVELEMAVPADASPGAGGPDAARAGHPGDRLQRARRDARRAAGSASAPSWPTAPGPGDVVVEVTDTGGGIPDARAAVGLRAVLHHAAGGHRPGPRDRQAVRRAERRPARDREPAGRGHDRAASACRRERAA